MSSPDETVQAVATLEPGHRDLALAARGLLRTFNEAGVLTAADVHVATRLGAILEEPSEPVLLAAALAVRAVRHGSVCVDLAQVAGEAIEVEGLEEQGAAGALAVLPWPDPATWPDQVAGSVLVSEGALRIEGSLLYLDRYWREERQVCDDLVARVTGQAPPEVDADLLAAGLDRVFPEHGKIDYSQQRAAAEAGVGRSTMLLTGGPGTGKTTTVAGLLALIAEQHQHEHGSLPRIALCAPTGKATARLQEAVDEAVAKLDPEDRARMGALQATTMHRLLGWRPGSSVRFRHDRHNRLPHDVVVVDETSMVSLTMMARLLEAVRPQTRLVLVGDPRQLSSVEAGAVFGDLVRGFGALGDASPVTELTHTHRFGATIAKLEQALRSDHPDADEVWELLTGPGDDVVRIDPEDAPAMAALRDEIADVAYQMRCAAEQGDEGAATGFLDDHRLLCAHREGPYGVSSWNRIVEAAVGERAGAPTYDEWYAGRPVLVTANDPGQRLSNGDMGVTVRSREGRLRVVMNEKRDVLRAFAPSRLPKVQTVFAMTVHKSQGSQAKTVTVVMPPPDSRLLTLELLYTAVTRAQEKVQVVGTRESVRAAIARSVQRASGLEPRLRAALGGD